MVLCLTSMLSPSFSILFDRKNFFISDRCEKEETLQHNLVFRLGQRQVFAFYHLDACAGMIGNTILWL